MLNYDKQMKNQSKHRKISNRRVLAELMDENTTNSQDGNTAKVIPLFGSDAENQLVNDLNKMNTGNSKQALKKERMRQKTLAALLKKVRK